MDIEHLFDHGESPDPTLDDPGRSPTIDELESMVGFAEREIGRMRALQILMLRSLDASGVMLAEGAEAQAAWVAARLDVDPATAADLVTAVHHMPMDLVGELRQGAIGFDRAMAESRLEMSGVDASRRAIGRRLDVDSVNRLARRGRRLISDIDRVLLGEPVIGPRRLGTPPHGQPPIRGVDETTTHNSIPTGGRPSGATVGGTRTVATHHTTAPARDDGAGTDGPIVVEEAVEHTAALHGIHMSATTSSGHSGDVSVTVDVQPAPPMPPPSAHPVGRGAPGTRPGERPHHLHNARRHPARDDKSSMREV